MPDTFNPDPKDPVTITLGCDPQVNVRLSETPQGTIFVVVGPLPDTKPTADIDGFFFNLSEDSLLNDLIFFPDVNQGSMFSPITGVQANANSVTTLSNGAQVKDAYDVGIQFGQVDNSTEGEALQTNFTLSSSSGPLLLDDLDLTSLATIVNSDGGAGQVLTTGDAPGDDPVFVETQALFENFNDIHRPTDSNAVESNTGWAVEWDQLVTNGSNDGTVTFQEVATDGPVTLTMDLNTHATHVFENAGHAADSLRIEVRIDGGEWMLLDEYQVNDAGSAIVGSETGQSFDAGGSTVTYAGGILSAAEDSAQFRVISHITADNEFIKIDNLSITTTEETTGEPVPAPVEVQSEVIAEDFDDLHRLTDSDNVVRVDGWDAAHEGALTSGHNDGVLQFAKVDTEGPASFSFDARVNNLNNFEASGRYADNLELQVRLDDGSWQTLDNFVVNHDKSALVGSLTGNEITEDRGALTYEGGILDTGTDSVQFRFVSDISATNEKILIDNVSVETTELVTPEDPNAEKIDFDDLATGAVISDQFAGVTISAQRAGDAANSENDAMIFDSNNPTGGDRDLAFDGRDNILIISEDNDSSDPDDNAHGGTISFDFEAPTDVLSLAVLDIEEPGGSIDLFDADGGLIRSIGIPTTGDGGAQDLSIDTDGVTSMNVNFVGSGAIDDLCYIPVDDDDCDAQYDVHYADGLPMLPPEPNMLASEMLEAEEVEEELVI